MSSRRPSCRESKRALHLQVSMQPVWPPAIGKHPQNAPGLAAPPPLRAVCQALPSCCEPVLRRGGVQAAQDSGSAATIELCQRLDNCCPSAQCGPPGIVLGKASGDSCWPNAASAQLR